MNGAMPTYRPVQLMPGELEAIEDLGRCPETECRHLRVLHSKDVLCVDRRTLIQCQVAGCQCYRETRP